MSNKKISDLPALGTAPAADDLMELSDTSGPTSKKVRIDELVPPTPVAFNAPSLGHLASQTHIIYGGYQATSTTNVGALLSCKPGVYRRMQVLQTGDALNVAGQTSTFEVLVNGVSQGSVSGIAAGAGTHGGSDYGLAITVAAGDLVAIRISQSAALTATTTDIHVTLSG